MEEEKEGGKENGHLVTKCERERKWEKRYMRERKLVRKSITCSETRARLGVIYGAKRREGGSVTCRETGARRGVIYGAKRREGGSVTC